MVDSKHHDAAKQLQIQLTRFYPLFRWRVEAETLYGDCIALKVSTAVVVNGHRFRMYHLVAAELVEDSIPDLLSCISNVITSELIDAMSDFNRRKSSE